MKQDPYQRYRRWEPLTSLAKILIGALAVSGGIALIQALQLAALTPRTADLRFPLTEAGIQLQNAIAPAPLAQVGSFITLLTGVIWLVWQHKAHSDLYARSIPGLRYTPGWAVGWWFVPFANVVMPFLTMRELFAFSGRAPAQVMLPPARDGRLGTWWAAYIGSSFIGAVGLGPLVGAFITSLSESAAGSDRIPVVTLTASAIHTAQTWAMIGDLARVAAAALAIWVVWTISVREDTAASPVAPAPPGVAVDPAGGLPPRPDLW